MVGAFGALWVTGFGWLPRVAHGSLRRVLPHQQGGLQPRRRMVVLSRPQRCLRAEPLASSPYLVDYRGDKSSTQWRLVLLRHFPQKAVCIAVGGPPRGVSSTACVGPPSPTSTTMQASGLMRRRAPQQPRARCHSRAGHEPGSAAWQSLRQPQVGQLATGAGDGDPPRNVAEAHVDVLARKRRGYDPRCAVPPLAQGGAQAPPNLGQRHGQTPDFRAATQPLRNSGTAAPTNISAPSVSRSPAFFLDFGAPRLHNGATFPLNSPGPCSSLASARLSGCGAGVSKPSFLHATRREDIKLGARHQISYRHCTGPLRVPWPEDFKKQRFPLLFWILWGPLPSSQRRLSRTPLLWNPSLGTLFLLS